MGGCCWVIGMHTGSSEKLGLWRTRPHHPWSPRGLKTPTATLPSQREAVVILHCFKDHTTGSKCSFAEDESQGKKYMMSNNFLHWAKLPLGCPTAPYHYLPRPWPNLYSTAAPSLILFSPLQSSRLKFLSWHSSDFILLDLCPKSLRSVLLASTFSSVKGG